MFGEPRVPLTKYLKQRISEDLEGVDWDLMEWIFGITIGLGVNAFFCYSRIYFPREYVTGPEENYQDTLLLLSILNALWMFSRSKAIYMVDKHAKELAMKSINSKLQFIPTPKEMEFQGLWYGFLIKWYRWMRGVGPKRRVAVWTIYIWNPSTFSLILFSLASPGQLLVYYLMDSYNYMYIGALAAIICFQMIMLTKHYSVLIMDKQVLHEEFFNEYNHEFVYKRTIANVNQAVRPRQ